MMKTGENLGELISELLSQKSSKITLNLGKEKTSISIESENLESVEVNIDEGNEYEVYVDGQEINMSKEDFIGTVFSNGKNLESHNIPKNGILRELLGIKAKKVL